MTQYSQLRGAGTYFETLTTGGSSHTKGSWKELAASTPWDSSRIHLNVRSISTAFRYGLIDLGIGAAGSESVIAADVAVHVGSDLLVDCGLIPIDVDIASGSRVAVRGQGSSASLNIGLSAMLEDRALGAGAVSTYGTVGGSSRGTTVDAHASTPFAFGSWVELVASTAAAHNALGIMVTTQNNAISVFTQWNVQIGVGSAGNEVPFCEFRMVANGTNDRMAPGFFKVFPSLSSAVRLAARVNSSSTTSGQRQVQVSLLGMNQP